MGVRRQIYLDDRTDELLARQRRLTGVSVSELVRRAVDQAYGGEGRLTWKEVWAIPLGKPNKDATDWDYDPLFDEERIKEIEDELDRHAPPGV